MRPITIHVSNASNELDGHLDMIDDADQRATSSARQLLNAETIDVLFVDAPDETLPEWGAGGYTYGPHVILIALDPTILLTRETIEATLVHEFHQAMRWRGPECDGTSLRCWSAREWRSYLRKKSSVTRRSLVVRASPKKNNDRRRRRCTKCRSVKLSGFLGPKK
jgi:hypothetical protein